MCILNDMQKEIGIAQIGYGYWGKNLTRVFANTSTLKAICDVDAAAAAEASQMYGVPHLSIERILDDKSIHAISLATPADTHASLACLAMEAGKNVFVEKPFATSVRDAQRMLDIARSSGQTLMVGHIMRYHPAFKRLLTEIRNGSIGRPFYIRSTRASFGIIRTSENVIWSFGCHDISMILAISNMLPISVSANVLPNRNNGIADIADIELTFNNQIKAHIHVSWLSPYKDHKITVFGEEGVLEFFPSCSSPVGQLALYNQVVDYSGSVPATNKRQPQFLDFSNEEPLALECNHFIECCRNGLPPLTDGVEGLNTVKILTEIDSVGH